jgi:hypothetical protein
VPVGNSSFPVTGVPANRGDLQSSLSVDGGPVGNGFNELYYDDALQLYGSHDSFAYANPPSTTETCSLATSVGVPPMAAKIGASGPLAISNILQDCSAGAAVIGASTVTWSLEFHGGVSYFCVNFDEVGSGGGDHTLEKDCIDTDTAGRLGRGALIMLRAPGFTLDMVAP